jgi:sensor histidine kinase YesM
MLLQPLVENAIKHGLEAHSTAGHVEIRARHDGDALLLTISDDGPGFRVPSPRRGHGLGIANVRSRLAQLYPDRHSFDLDDAPGGGTRVTIRIPFVLAPATIGSEPESSSRESGDGAAAVKRLARI